MGMVAMFELGEHPAPIEPNRKWEEREEDN
jgi:hypothetical protein